MTDPARRTELELAEHYVDLLNERRLDELDSILPADFASHLRVGDISGREPFKALVRSLYDGIPDVLWTVEEYICAPGRVVIRYFFQGTHMGPFLGIPPCHKLVRLEGAEVLHIRDGRIHEIWNYTDVMGLASRLQSIEPLSVEV